ncbi:type II toxin-antitoxin system PemK/MazF family toxin [Aquihabitans daechungensis]|uniref:type II toxin-antitoxin system PemK/MazF family toxin n=1 Tax=Aquihabitans daechungensis TaxID=1052257 RepID=UPI003BA396C1
MAGTGPLRRLKDKVTSSLSRDRSGTGGITVSYAPERDGDADPGEVVWTWVPFEDDPTQGKDRPVLVLGWDGPRLAAVQLSSKDHRDRRDAHEWVEVGRGAWDPQNRVSFADASRLLRVEPGEVRREGASLDESAFERVLQRVAQLHGWTR